MDAAIDTGFNAFDGTIGSNPSAPKMQGRYGYYFAHAARLPVDEETLSRHMAVVQAMLDGPAEAGTDTSAQSPMLRAITRFITHDVSALSLESALHADPASRPEPLAREALTREAVNGRSGRFDLVSLYGPDTVTGDRALDTFYGALRCPQDRAKMWMSPAGTATRVTAGRPVWDLLRLGDVLDHGALTADDLYALPEHQRQRFLEADDTPRRTAAIIAEPRNDDSLLTAQLHLALLQFHNQMVHAYPGGRRPGDADRIFVWAREQVTLFFQWLVLNEWLPQICDRRTVASIRALGPILYDDFLATCDWNLGDALPIPMEFCSGTMTLGALQDWDSYDWTSDHRRPKGSGGIAQLKRMTAPGGKSGPDRLPADWAIDWQRMAYPPICFAGQSAPTGDAPRTATAPTSTGDAGRNTPSYPIMQALRESLTFDLPTAQSAAVGLAALGLNVPILRPDQIAAGPAATAIQMAEFASRTPLWFYTLKEAEVLAGGNHLGPLASNIVAGTIIGLIDRTPGSVLNTPGSVAGGWHPVDGPRVSGQLVDSFPALLRAALLLPNPDHPDGASG